MLKFYFTITIMLKHWNMRIVGTFDEDYFEDCKVIFVFYLEAFVTCSVPVSCT